MYCSQMDAPESHNYKFIVSNVQNDVINLPLTFEGGLSLKPKRTSLNY